jgi:glycyl-tRNA synthetase beta chain
MPKVCDFLIEIGTEELPARGLCALSEALRDAIVAEFAKAGLTHGETAVYATPRRLAVLASELLCQQPERRLERRGPPLSQAFDDDGEPTKAALGFARSCGVELSYLDRLETPEGGWLVFRTTEAGQPTKSLLEGIMHEALARLPVAKRMRWGNLSQEFVRPVHWLVLLLGEDVAEIEVLGVVSGRTTRGHRFHAPGPLTIAKPGEYAALLYENGHVIADFATRREMIRRQVEEAAEALGGRALVDEELLEEVTALVEWPVAIAGSFDAEFLKLPAALLIAVMKGNQRYFSVVDEAGAIQPHFITVCNIESKHPQSVRQGNERVIRPRLRDAVYFYERDQQRPLESYLEQLQEVVFQEKLGSVYDKSRRVSRLSAHIAIAMGAARDDVELARRAGLLCKCDLVTEMVGEFPELQGYMGREYAAQSGEPESVALALEEAYLPRFAGDRVPLSTIGRAVAIADKLDTLVGIFALGQTPTGDRDPFALRRAALGIVRIIIEGELDLDLRKLLSAAAEEYPDCTNSANTVEQAFEFILERLRAYFAEQGITPDVFNAVLARQPTRPYDFARRLWAVNQFRTLPEAASLAAANKRIGNILRQAASHEHVQVNEALLKEDAEWNLAAKLVGLTPRVKDMQQSGDYAAALSHLAGLGAPVDQFFDQVKVMVEENAVRENRLALLHQIHSLFLETADISRLQS